MASVRFTLVAASLMALPSLTAQQQQFLGYPSQQLASPQIPYAQSLIASPQQLQMDTMQVPSAQVVTGSPQQIASMQNPYAGFMSLPRQPASPPSSFLMQQRPPPNLNPAMLYSESASQQSTILALQLQLATEHSKEVQLANTASEQQEEMTRMKQAQQEEMTRMNRSFEEQLANSTAVNDALRIKLGQVQDEETQKVKELSDAQAQVSALQEKVQAAQAKRAEGAKQDEQQNLRALRVMKDVQVAQAKVQRTEEILRSIVPRLLLHRPSQTVLNSAKVDASDAGPAGKEQLPQQVLSRCGPDGTGC